MKRPLIGGKDFKASIRQREHVQRKVMEAYLGREEYLVLGEGERKRMNV
jgi:hypothetical protein